MYKTSFGISRNSLLNELEEFHVTSGLPPDIMHDIFEGVAVVELHCLLSALIKDHKLFSLAQLNNKIKKFPYGIPDRNNKPLPLPVTYLSKSSTEALKQNCKLLSIAICSYDPTAFVIVPLTYNINSQISWP